jgi:streptomycin 6-kinase
MKNMVREILNGPVFTAFDPAKLKPILRRPSWLERLKRGFGRHARLEQQVAAMARNNLELARQVQELHRRLAHHEHGPLAGSKRDLDKARGNGASRIIRV